MKPLSAMQLRVTQEVGNQNDLPAFSGTVNVSIFVVFLVRRRRSQGGCAFPSQAVGEVRFAVSQLTSAPTITSIMIRGYERGFSVFRMAKLKMLHEKVDIMLIG